MYSTLTYADINTHFIQPEARTCAVIGNFDGVHLGHQSLFECARSTGMPIVAITFDPHPREVLTDCPPPRLLAPSDRADLLTACGARDILTITFSKEFASVTPEDFIRRVLLERFNIGMLVCGYDFSLGKGRTGNADALREFGKRYGFSVHQLSAALDSYGNAISSTSIRSALFDGRIGDANAMLGRAYIVRGSVVHGQHRGHSIGFPTANLSQFFSCLALPYGVYATRILIPSANTLPSASLHTRHIGRQSDGSTVYASVTNIGCNPTFGGKTISIETHIPNFIGDLYGKPVELSFMARIRAERRFESLDALKAQLAEDTRKALEYTE